MLKLAKIQNAEGYTIAEDVEVELSKVRQESGDTVVEGYFFSRPDISLENDDKFQLQFNSEDFEEWMIENPFKAIASPSSGVVDFQHRDG